MPCIQLPSASSRRRTLASSSREESIRSCVQGKASRIAYKNVTARGAFMGMLKESLLHEQDTGFFVQFVSEDSTGINFKVHDLQKVVICIMTAWDELSSAEHKSQDSMNNVLEFIQKRQAGFTKLPRCKVCTALETLFWVSCFLS